MIRLSITDANDLSRGELERAIQAAFVVAGFIFVCLIGAPILGLISQFPYTTLAVAFILFVLAALPSLIILLGLRRGQGVVNAIRMWVDADRMAKMAAFEAARETVPALPAALPEPNDESFRLNRGGVGEDVPKNLVHGFDPRDLEWLAQYLSNGNKWTEAVLERMPLPYSKEKFGKAEGNTPYMRLFGVPDGVIVRAQIITGRGGPGNSAGKLAVTDAKEIVQRIKQLP